jgi:hypothetical protein
LNPLRAGIVEKLMGLNTYPYCGHSALMGKTEPGIEKTEHRLFHGERIRDERTANRRGARMEAYGTG